MNELQRQAYLDAMGVEILLPKVLLPGALPSVQCEVPAPVAGHVFASTQLASRTVSTPPHSDRTLAKARRSDAMAALLSDVGVENKPSNVDIPADKKELPSVKAKTPVVPRFCLEFFAVERWLFIDEGVAAGSRDYQMLLQNLCFALGIKATGMEVVRFKWPLVEGSHIDQSEPAALQTLKAFIARQAKQHQLQCIAGMGGQAKRYVLDHADFFDLKSFGITDVLEAPSLAAAFDQPALKPVIWRALNTLLSENQQ